MTELLDVAKVERLALNPGDIVVIKTPAWLTDQEFARFGETLRAALPAGTKVLFLEAGVDISVLSGGGE